MSGQHHLVLGGCTPEPILHYLKALGVLRLVTEQADGQARAAWEGNQFHLHTSLDRENLVQFLLERYRPTPILAPWNGGSGFWDTKAAGRALLRVADSSAPRLTLYRETIAAIQKVIAELGLTKTALKDKESKTRLIRRLRSVLPEETIAWIDALAVITGNDFRFVPAPVLGTGANDGNLDFTKNFMERLDTILPFQPAQGGSAPAQGKKPRKGETNRPWSRECLEASLFAQGNPSLETAALGQFHPGGAGGANAAQGFDGTSLVNPWDYILMIEGSLVLAGAAARRLGSDTGGRAAFPFTTSTSLAGSGTVSETESQSSRAEIWLPLWGRPSTFSEVRHLFAEGRAQVGTRQARTGLDFARAVAGLGVNRGIAAFQRYAFVQRNGLAFLAAPLGRLAVRTQPDVFLIDELDPWLNEVRRIATPSAELRSALREVGETIFAFCERGGAGRLQDVVAAVGRTERAIAMVPKVREQVRPLQQMSMRWLRACDDGMPEFRLAASIASIRHKDVGRIREQLEPVEWQSGRWVWRKDARGLVWVEGALSRSLLAILERRLIDGARQNCPLVPIESDLAVTLADVHAYLTGQVDERRIADLIWGLAGLRWPDSGQMRPLSRDSPAPELDRSYVLLKLLFLPSALQVTPGQEGVPVKSEAAILSMLRAGRLAEAVSIAYRRLRASGLTPLGTGGKHRRTPPRFSLTCSDPARLASALLVPVFETRKLTELVLWPSSEGEGARQA